MSGCKVRDLTVDFDGVFIASDPFFRKHPRDEPGEVGYGTLAARLLGIPVINNISGLGTAFLRTTLRNLIARTLYKFSQKFAYLVFCQNEDDFDAIKNMSLVPIKKLNLIPGSGVDLKRFNPEKREANQGPFRFLYAGRMLYDKGLLEPTNSERPFRYRPVRSSEEVSSNLLGDLLERVFGGSREQLFVRLLEQKKLTAGERRILERILKEHDK